MKYYDFISIINHTENDIQVKFDGDNGWFYIFEEPKEYWDREIKSIDILVDGERVADETDEIYYNSNKIIRNTDSIHILIK